MFDEIQSAEPAFVSRCFFNSRVVQEMMILRSLAARAFAYRTAIGLDIHREMTDNCNTTARRISRPLPMLEVVPITHMFRYSNLTGSAKAESQ